MNQCERVREIRKQLGLTLDKFGEKLGVTKTAISRIERGERNCTEQMIKSICREFNVDYMWLTTGEGNMFIDSDNDVMNAIDRIMAGESEFHKKLLKWCATSFTDEELLLLERKIDEFISEFSKKEPPISKSCFQCYICT